MEYGKIKSKKRKNLSLSVMMVFVIMILCSSLSAYADNEYLPLTINQIEVDENVVKSVRVSVVENIQTEYAKAFVGVYQDGVLVDFSQSQTPVSIENKGEIDFFVDEISFIEGQEIVAFVWSCDTLGNLTMRPLAKEYKYGVTDPTEVPQPSDTPGSTNQPEPSETPAPTDQPEPTSTIEPVGDGIIHLRGNAIYATGVVGTTVDGNNITISQPGEYMIDGTLNDGQIIINTSSKSDEVILNLDNVNISCSYAEPVSGLKGSVTLKTADKSVNTFTDSSENQLDSRNNGCVYSKNDLTINGTGEINIKGNFSNGIRCKADVEVKGGVVLNISAANNGIKADESFESKKATISIISGNDGIKTDCIDDLKKGYIDISNSNSVIDITTFGTAVDPQGGDGIQADRAISIGDGKITINSNADGIKVGNDSDVESEKVYGTIKISGGTIEIVSGEDGIQSNYMIDISGGTIDITDCAEDGIRCKTAFEIPSEPYSDGFINISGGDIKVVSAFDAIQADTELVITGGNFDLIGGSSLGASQGTINSNSVNYSCKGIKSACLIDISDGRFNVDSFDDSIHSNGAVLISGGDFVLSSNDDGIHSDTELTIGGSETKIDILKSYEGLEALTITINGGETRLVASDDGINAAGGKDSSGNPGSGGGPGQGVPGGGASDGMIYLNDGYVFVNAAGDGIDSNGNIEMNGGKYVICGPTNSGDGALDFDGKFTVNGGFLVAAGSTGMVQYPTTSSICFANITFGSSSQGGGKPGGGNQGSLLEAGTLVQIEDGDGNDVLTFSPLKEYNSVVFVSPDMKSGTSYNVYSGGTCTDYESLVDGIYTGSAYQSTGATTATFTASASGTNVTVK